MITNDISSYLSQLKIKKLSSKKKNYLKVKIVYI